MLPLNLTPYVMGLPYRIDALERLLAWLADQAGARFHGLGDLVGALD